MDDETDDDMDVLFDHMFRNVAVDEATYLPIVPTSRLWLPMLKEGDDHRFAGIFRDTWKVIPLWGRRKMVKHWRNCPSWTLPGPWSPQVALIDGWDAREPKGLAGCFSDGHCLYFHAPVVDAMPVQHVGELIAHELAHVYLEALGNHSNTDRNMPRWNDPGEEDADYMMQCWGFDPWAMDDWLKKHW